MAKINYSKVEEALNEGLHKMKVENLCKIAEVTQSVGKTDMLELTARTVARAQKKSLEHKATLHVLRRRAKFHTNNDFYKEFDLTFDTFRELLTEGRKVTNEEEKKLKAIKLKMLEAKEKQIAENPDLSNDNAVERIRKEQKDARINVPKKWHPLK